MNDLATNRARAAYIAKAAERELQMQHDDICAGLFLRLNRPELPKVEPVTKRVAMNLFNAPEYHRTRQHIASLSPERRAMLDAEWNA
jgi:hypothetical protein